MSEKNSELRDKLFAKRHNGWECTSDEEKKVIFDFSKEYINFLNVSKTEREAIAYSKVLAEKNGFKNIKDLNELHSGDKVYYINRDKNIYLAVIGEENLENGLHLIGAHIDSPRLDLKPNPLYESDGFALLRTHYYGSIKKYQWVTIPLAIHGVIVKTNGEKVNVVIGENDEEPIFTITDLLPHLAEDQMTKKVKDAIEGENLNLLVGNIPFDDSKVGDKVKLNIMNILHEKYGMVEKDFLSAELELVPAFKARSLGFDESMIAGYGQDDRACGYMSLRAILDIEKPKKTAICILVDKEEIGSIGNTGMQTKMFDVFVAELLDKTKQNNINALEKVYGKSKMISADVNGAFDPLYSSVYEKSNAAYIGEGVGLNKYTGARGKAMGSDASAEFVAEIRNMLEQNNIPYNISELGKVDSGGGGTIAYILANKGIDVIDCGVALLSMHSPYEVTSKYDIYTTYRAYKAFYDWK